MSVFEPAAIVASVVTDSEASKVPLSLVARLRQLWAEAAATEADDAPLANLDNAW